MKLFGGGLVHEAAPARQAEAGEEARTRVPIVLDAGPALRKRRVDPGIEAQPVDVSALAAPEEPVTPGLRLNCRAALRLVVELISSAQRQENTNRARWQDRPRRRLTHHANMVIVVQCLGSARQVLGSAVPVPLEGGCDGGLAKISPRSAG